MADVTARNARLTQLVTASQAWAAARTTELNNRVTSAKAILAGRTGADSLANAGVSAASALVVSSIDDFLTPDQ
jgi:hypothetical protein